MLTIVISVKNPIVKKLKQNLQDINNCMTKVSIPAQRVLNPSDVRELLERISDMNTVNKVYTPFMIGDSIYGYIQDNFLIRMQKRKDLFQYYPQEKIIRLNEDLINKSNEERSDLIHSFSRQLRDEGLIKGWRDEFLGVSLRYSTPPVFLIERAVYSYFGLKGYGVHINGYVRDVNGVISHLWVAKRSATKSTYPGMLDHIVGEIIDIKPYSLFHF
jgi:hypothetical protein